MRVFALAFVAALTVTQGPPSVKPPASVSLAGRVTTGSGPETRPVRRAVVRLSGGRLMTPRETETDRTGAYAFDRLASGGDFRITVMKPGFVRYERPVSPDAVISLTRGSAIEGIVTDASGDTVSNLLVTALQTKPKGGSRPVVLTDARTDDLGRYRLHSLPEGDYAIEVAADITYLANGPRSPDGRLPETLHGYYPASATLEDAKRIHLPAGREVTGIDIVFTPPVTASTPSAPRSNLIPPPSDFSNTSAVVTAGTARIAGTLVDAASGKPIKYAGLQLSAVDGRQMIRSSRTDAKGRFEYAALEARRYALRFTADRHITMYFGQTRAGELGTRILIPLRDGEDYRADMKLPRASAIEGTLLDEFGDPVPGVFVQVSERTYAAGRYRLMPVVGVARSHPTDDRGHYRVSNVAPGSYYVAALPGVFGSTGRVGGFAPTWYPGTIDAGAAAPVLVNLGVDTLETTFALAPARTFTVSGTMLDAGGRPVTGRGALMLTVPDRLGRMDSNPVLASTGPDGTFVFHNVPQGSYTLQGFAPAPADYKGPMNMGAMPFGWVPLTVGDADLDGVALTTTPGTKLRGKIVLEDTSLVPPKPDQVRVSTVNMEFDSAPIAGGPEPSETRDDLTFEVTRQYGLRRILVFTSTSSWTLRRITLNDRDVTDETLDFRTRDVDGVEVVLTPKVSRVEGTVSDDKGSMSDYAVVIFSSDPTRWFDRSRFVVMARPSEGGRFSVTGLPPDDYLAVALSDVVGREFTDPGFLDALRPIATAFSLGDGQSATLQLKLKKR